MPLTFQVKVTPSAGRVAWVLDKSGILKCYLKSPPEQGKANKELIKLLAKALKVTSADVEIVSGLASRTKRITVATNITFEDLIALLGIERQTMLFS